MNIGGVPALAILVGALHYSIQLCADRQQVLRARSVVFSVRLVRALGDPLVYAHGRCEKRNSRDWNGFHAETTATTTTPLSLYFPCYPTMHRPRGHVRQLGG